MILGGADMRRALERYPDVTRAERDALLGWYAQARAVELVAALDDPRLGPPLARLRRDNPVAARNGMTATIIVAALLVASHMALG